MRIELVTSQEDIVEAAKVLLQLRPQYTLDSLVVQMKKQQAMGYHIVCAKAEDKIAGVAGFVISEKLAWKKHIYVDDLVTNEQQRSTGVGTALIEWLKAYGIDNGCEQLHLDSSVVKHAAHRFYLQNGFHISSHHFSIVELGET